MNTNNNKIEDLIYVNFKIFIYETISLLEGSLTVGLGTNVDMPSN